MRAPPRGCMDVALRSVPDNCCGGVLPILRGWCPGGDHIRDRPFRLRLPGSQKAQRLGRPKRFELLIPRANDKCRLERPNAPDSPRFLVSPGVRQIVRDAQNSHGGKLPECQLVPCFRGFVAGAARGIRTPDPVITKEESDGLFTAKTAKARRTGQVKMLPPLSAVRYCSLGSGGVLFGSLRSPITCSNA
jgi:hypothetical protein